MTYEPVSFRSFGGGLNLRDKEDAVSETECIDALNVNFTTRGAVQQRNGFASLTSALTHPARSLEPFYTTGGTRNLIAGCRTRLEALDTTGAVVDSATGFTDAIWDFARFGAPGQEVIYAGNGTDQLQRWDGTNWSIAGSNPPHGGALAVMAVDQGNRLVNGGFDTAAGGPGSIPLSTNPSTVWFSDAGAPETWGVNNYVHFTPGDGEKVQVIVAWRELLFIFKETKFFIVYGTTVDASGNPVFNYRTIETGCGAVGPRAAIGADDGVYFVDRKGVYRTTGGEPALVSSAIDPIFIGGESSFYTGGVLNHTYITNCALGFHEHQLYLGYTSESATVNDRTLVYDPRFDWWSLYDFDAACFASFRVGDKAELVFGDTSGSLEVKRHSSSYTDDDGTAITSLWRSGWFDYDLTQVKTIRESKAWGTGRVYMAIAHDFNINLDGLDLLDFTPPDTSTWGTSTWGGTFWGSAPGLLPKLRRRANRGTVFSTYLTNTTDNQGWSLHRLAHHLREQRIPSIVEA